MFAIWELRQHNVVQISRQINAILVINLMKHQTSMKLLVNFNMACTKQAGERETRRVTIALETSRQLVVLVTLCEGLCLVYTCRRKFSMRLLYMSKLLRI